MTTIKLSSLKSNANDDGEWEDIADWPGVRLKVRSIRSRDFQQQRDLLMQKLTRKLGRLPTSSEADGGLRPLLARHLLRGWEGFDLEYSPEAALEILSDPEHQPMAEQIVWAASRAGDREVEFTDQAVKNSAAPSATT